MIVVKPATAFGSESSVRGRTISGCSKREVLSGLLWSIVVVDELLHEIDVQSYKFVVYANTPIIVMRGQCLVNTMQFIQPTPLLEEIWFAKTSQSINLNDVTVIVFTKRIEKKLQSRPEWRKTLAQH